MDRKPKSALELAMERLEAADREAGIDKVSLTRGQKSEIAEIRKVAASRLAEREILHRDALKRTQDPAVREKLEEEFRIDRRRIEADRDQAIEKARRGGG